MGRDRFLSVVAAAGIAAWTSLGTAQTLYESAALGPTGITVPVVGIDYDQFLGARFEVKTTAQVTHVGGHLNSLGPGPAGTLFAALIKLRSWNDLPDGGHPFGPADIVIATTTFNPGALSNDFQTPLAATLQPGIYGIVFGAGELGSPKAAHGGMPPNNADLPGRSYFRYNGKEGLEEWQNGGSAGLRFLVVGKYLETGPITISGTIDLLPSGALTGDWLVSGRTVRVSSATRVDQAQGPATVHACVSIDGVLNADSSVGATQVAVLSSSGGCSAPPVELRFYGIVQAMPQSGAAGDWTVGGRRVRVDSSTAVRLNRQATGMCVSVEGRRQSDGAVLATRLDGESTDCELARRNATPPGFCGLVQALPASGSTGDWRIGARTVRVSASTTLARQNGEAVLGACMDVSGALEPDGVVSATRMEVLSSSGTCLFPGGVVNAASFSGAAVTPGLIVSVFGFNLGPVIAAPMQVGLDRRLASRLSNVRVLVDGIPAPLIFAAAQQINAVVPYGIAGRDSVQVQVENNDGWSNAVILPVVSAAPAIFTVAQSGKGQGAILNYDSATGALTVNGRANAAPRGSFVSIYATGEGQTNPPGQDGQVIDAVLPRPILPVRVNIGGQDCPAEYAGAAPGLVAGVIQVNVRVPDNVPPAPEVPVILRIGDWPSPQGVTMAVR